MLKKRSTRSLLGLKGAEGGGGLNRLQPESNATAMATAVAFYGSTRHRHEVISPPLSCNVVYFFFVVGLFVLSHSQKPNSVLLCVAFSWECMLFLQFFISPDGYFGNTFFHSRSRECVWKSFCFFFVWFLWVSCYCFYIYPLFLVIVMTFGEN